MNNTASSNAQAAVFVVLVLLVYWMPTFIAIGRRVHGLAQVVVVNLFLGWTFFGWVAALVMAFRSRQPRVMQPR